MDRKFQETYEFDDYMSQNLISETIVAKTTRTRTRTVGVIMNKVGRRLGPSDDIASSDNDKYDSDFIDDSGDNINEPDPDSSYEPSSLDSLNSPTRNTIPKTSRTSNVVQKDRSHRTSPLNSTPGLETAAAQVKQTKKGKLTQSKLTTSRSVLGVKSSNIRRRSKTKKPSEYLS